MIEWSIKKIIYLTKYRNCCEHIICNIGKRYLIVILIRDTTTKAATIDMSRLFENGQSVTIIKI